MSCGLLHAFKYNKLILVSFFYKLIGQSLSWHNSFTISSISLPAFIPSVIASISWKSSPNVMISFSVSSSNTSEDTLALAVEREVIIDVGFVDEETEEAHVEMLEEAGILAIEVRI